MKSASITTWGTMLPSKSICGSMTVRFGGLEGCRARDIVRPSFTPRVRCALKLEHQPLGGAVEVNDEPMQHVLAPKLEAEDTTIPQQRPRVSLGGRRRASQLARLRKLPAGRDTPERIHTAHTRAASSRHQNRNIAPWSMLLRYLHALPVV